MNYFTSPFERQDFYKLSHILFYTGISGTYATYTPRVSRRPGIDKMVVFGLQAFIVDLQESFQTQFFNLTKEDALSRFIQFNEETGRVVDERFTTALGNLHDLGYLPIKIKALKEGTLIPHNLPMATVQSTHKDHFWVAQWVETWMSTETWRMCTSATTAYYYRKILNEYRVETSEIDWLGDWQCHDFSARGMAGLDDASMSGASHCLFFTGSDACSVVPFVKKFYPGDNGLVLSSVAATEHSIQQSFMAINGEITTTESDLLYTKNTLEKVPTGIVSQVSDGYDYYRFLRETLPAVKDIIMARDGKFVIRPDSSPKTPYEILLGDPDAPEGSIERMGTIPYLAQLFGTTVNKKGYKVLDPHIGVLYGEAITLLLWKKILQGLKDLRFSSDNIVVGVGSASYTGYGGGIEEKDTYQPYGISRDTHGLAIKETAVLIEEDGELVWKPTYKDPATDTSGKKSHYGLVQILEEDGEFVVKQDVTPEEEASGLLETIFEDSKITRMQSFAEVRAVAKRYL